MSRTTLAKELTYQRMESDTDKSWEAFIIYRDMGPERSCEKVRKRLGKSDTLIEGWCTQHQWVKRVALWDAFLDNRERAQMLYDHQSAAIQQQRRSRLMQEVAELELKKHQALSEEANGPLLDADKAGSLMEKGVKLERVVMGQPTEITEQKGSGIDWEALDADEIQILKAILVKATKKKETTDED